MHIIHWLELAGWLKLPLAISHASLSQRIPKPEHISAQGKQGWVPTTPGKVGPPGTGAGAHSSQAEKEKEVELQAGKVCDIRVTAEFILQQALACFSCLIVLVIVVKCIRYAMVGLVTLATANYSARNHL